MLSIIVFMILCMLLGSPLLYCAPTDNLTTGSSLRDRNNDTLISAGGRFQLGFFAPTGNSSYRRYIGIWYLSDPQTVVWVANRDNPLTVRTGIFTLAKDGNLKIINGNDNHYFFTNLSRSSNRTLKLLDSGNLVLSDDQLGTTSWQSFENPTDTFLPGMKMNETLTLTSGISGKDPGSGNFTFKQDDDENHYIINLKNTGVYWKAGVTGSFVTSRKIPLFVAALLSNLSNPVNQTLLKSYDKGKAEVDRNYSNSRMLMKYSGEIQFFSWEDKTGWSLIWSQPGDRCRVNNACGNFGSCNINNKTMMCKCLPGFEPSSPDDFSSGCTRPRNSITCNKNDTFQNLRMMGVGKPDFSMDAVESEKDCTKNCLDKCDCQAYSYKEANRTRRGDTAGVRRCWIWTSNLNNLQEDVVDGYNLSIRVMVSVIIVVLLFCIITFISYKRRVTNQQERGESRERIRAYPVLHLYDSERQVKDLIDSGQFKEEDKKGIDVPFFDLESILAATDNFSDANKLGQGGFGPVYKIGEDRRRSKKIVRSANRLEDLEAVSIPFHHTLEHTCCMDEIAKSERGRRWWLVATEKSEWIVSDRRGSEKIDEDCEMRE
ncbi:hypothetical protein F0562_010941 [Nyssa sinensis]|uniref:non-specific serine/threonine protein kinase n=1 Tax=Nyssa sinensis TaxID=561372 RepID=A0A5J5A3C9_9ASTE|nr:hypothetical protein F0562_010941 [Nyssa sinensis]